MVTERKITSPEKPSEASHSEGRSPDKKAFFENFQRYGWDGTYDAAVKAGYTRSFSGMVYAAKRMGLGAEQKKSRHVLILNGIRNCRFPEKKYKLM